MYLTRNLFLLPDFHKFWFTIRVSDDNDLTNVDQNTLQPCLKPKVALVETAVSVAH